MTQGPSHCVSRPASEVSMRPVFPSPACSCVMHLPGHHAEHHGNKGMFCRLLQHAVTQGPLYCISRPASCCLCTQSSLTRLSFYPLCDCPGQARCSACAHRVHVHMHSTPIASTVEDQFAVQFISVLSDVSNRRPRIRAYSKANQQAEPARRLWSTWSTPCCFPPAARWTCTSRWPPKRRACQLLFLSPQW